MSQQVKKDISPADVSVDLVKPVHVTENVLVTSVLDVDHQPKIHKGCPPFQHAIKDACKNIGVLFHKRTPQAYIKPLSILREGSTAQDYLRVVSSVAMSGRPNYLGCRTQLHSNFNLPLWEKELKRYHDRNVMNLLRFGFPLGIHNREGLNRRSIENHFGATIL